MIPKIIHYCWFGNKEMPELAISCINSWKKYLPDYELKLWNESNFNLDLYPYAKEAYEAKKFAFVTDVVRLYALKTFGGIYMDTDVEILKPIDSFLSNNAFSGFESDFSVPTGIMSSEKNGQWITDLLNYYDNKRFLDRNGNPDLTTNVVVISDMMKQKGLLLNNKYQELKNYVTFYPSEYFCPKSPADGKINITEKTYCIHHFAGSWASPPTLTLKFKIFVSKLIRSLIGDNVYKKVYSIYKK